MTAPMAPIIKDALKVIRYSDFRVSSRALTALLRIFMYMRFRGALDSETYMRLVSLATNACRYSIQDGPQDKSAIVVTADEQVPPPAAPSGLRLLCLLCQKTGAYQPVATLHPMPPRSLFSGRWPNAAGERALATCEQYVPLGLGLYLSPALNNPAPASVLVRGGEHRQANTLRPALGSVRAGDLTV